MQCFSFNFILVVVNQLAILLKLI